jgi:glycosyltransferase involved in cell wall biosynthesis
MSTSLLQAMAMEIPVIGSRVPGITDVLGKKNIGLLFDNNIEDLSNKIRFFYLSNKKIKLQFIKAQRNYVQLNHSYIKMFDRYYYEIRTLLQF